MPLTPIQQRFILHWGEMGAKWGINRTVAQVHALLYISENPLNAEEITETLSVARSNVSNSLRELVGWGIVKTSHKMGDRRDYFHTLEDVWEMFEVIVAERKKREIDPTAQLIRECVEEAGNKKREAFTHKRLTEMLDFLETMTSFYDQFSKLPRDSFLRFAKMGAKLTSFFGITPRKKSTKPK